MSQTYLDIQETTTLKNSRQMILDRDNASVTNFSGTAAPSGSHVLDGILYYNTTLKALFVLESSTPSAVWKRIPMVAETNGAIAVTEGGTGGITVGAAKINLGLNINTEKEGLIDVVQVSAGGTGGFSQVTGRAGLGITLDVSNAVLPAASGGTGFNSLAGLAGGTGLNLGSLATASDGVPDTTKLWGHAFTDVSGFRTKIGLGSAALATAGENGTNVLALGGSSSSTGIIPTNVFNLAMSNYGIKNGATTQIYSGTADPTTQGTDGDVYLQYT